MTPDTPRLTRGQRFDLARETARALEGKIEQEHRSSLLGQFGFQQGEFSTWLDDLLSGEESDLIELAAYLGVPGEPETVEQALPDVSDIDAYAELVSAETALREVVRLAAPNWIDDLTTDEVARLEEKLAEEDKRRDGVTVSRDFLDYTEIHQLERTINKHWEPGVRAILDDKKRTDVYLNIIGDIRNAIGHSRPIYPAERLLLAGAARQIRNQLSIYRSRADGPHLHYPSIDSARDDGGRTGRHNGEGLSDLSKDALHEIPRINVGDEIVFDMEATDPRGRELDWIAHSVPYGEETTANPSFARATGNRVNITWKVTEADYGEYRRVQIALRNGGGYHRYKHWDDGAAFYYHVNPPSDA